MDDSSDNVLQEAELQRALAELDAASRRVEELRRQNRGKVIADIKEKIREYGLTPADLGFGEKSHVATAKAGAVGDGRPKDGRSVVQPKYVGPNGERWSGRGKDPGWLKDQIAQGRRKEEFLVADSLQSVK